MNPYQNTVVERSKNKRQVPLVLIFCISFIVIPPLLLLTIPSGVRHAKATPNPEVSPGVPSTKVTPNPEIEAKVRTLTPNPDVSTGVRHSKATPNPEIEPQKKMTRKCLFQNLDENKELYLQVCPPYYESKRGETIVAYVSVLLHNEVLQFWKGNNCNILINWLRSCFREDLAGCPLLIPFKFKDEECLKKSYLDLNTYLCFQSSGHKRLFLNNFGLTSHETKTLKSFLLSAVD